LSNSAETTVMLQPTFSVMLTVVVVLSCLGRHWRALLNTIICGRQLIATFNRQVTLLRLLIASSESHQICLYQFSQNLKGRVSRLWNITYSIYSQLRWRACIHSVKHYLHANFLVCVLISSSFCGFTCVCYCVASSGLYVSHCVAFIWACCMYVHVLYGTLHSSWLVDLQLYFVASPSELGFLWRADIHTKNGVTWHQKMDWQTSCMAQLSMPLSWSCVVCLLNHSFCLFQVTLKVSRSD